MDPESAKRMGVLMATGLIVGDSLLNVAFAGVVAGTGSGAPLAILGDDFAGTAIVLGTLAFAALLYLLYRRTAR
jgi:hypothetical protein